MNRALSMLYKAAYEKRLAHLLLMHGGSAIERRESALRLAQALNCEEPSIKGPCRACVPCRKIQSGNHPDVSILQSEKTSIGIEQILQWQSKVYRKHYEGNYKVFLIDQADKLTIPAANALLKVIEEPPERTEIILSTENAQTILPTIQSRAQLVYFPDPSQEEWFSKFDNISMAQKAFALSGGNPELAEMILEHGVDRVEEWVKAFDEVTKARDFVQLTSLFPIEKHEALIYLEVMAHKAKGRIYAGHGVIELLTIGQAIDALRQQANPRLVMEVLALRLFRQGGKD